MYERITLDQRDIPGKPIDIGLLAQCLVFYQTTRVIVDQVTFPYLVRSCGAEEVLHLVSMGALEIEYFENLSGVITRQIGHEFFHDYGNITSSSLRYMGIARKLFDELAGPSGKGANKYFDRFARIVKRSQYTSEMAEEGRKDWSDDAYMTEASRALVKMMAPTYKIPEQLYFHANSRANGYVISSNLDFDAADIEYRNLSGNDEKTLTPAYILSQVTVARRDMIVGSQFGSEFALSPKQSLITSCKFAQILSTAAKGLTASDIFQEEVIDELPNIRETVNFGDKPFSRVIQLVEQADKFKKWLRNQSETDELRRAYLRDVSHLDWADRLPPKSLRWLLITGAGTLLGASSHPLIGAAAGTALSAADTFLLDRLLRGWKPNQFIEGPLKQFLNV